MYKYLLIFGVTLLFLSTFLARSIYAADDCTIIYGGGEVKCEATKSAETATPSPSAQANQPSDSGTTKGGLPAGRQGLPVYEPAKTTETPATGPEAYALITLIPAAALGYYLRNKVK